MIDITLKRLYLAYYLVLGFSFIAVIFNFINRSKCHKQVTKNKKGNIVRYGHIIGFNVFMIILILAVMMLMVYLLKDTDDRIKILITIGVLLLLLITFVLSVSYFRICSTTKHDDSIDPDYFKNGVMTFNVISLLVIIVAPVLNFTLLSDS